MNIKRGFLLMIAATLAACASKDTNKLKRPETAEASGAQTGDSLGKVIILDQEPIESDEEIQLTEFTEDEASFDELEEEFALVNKEQIQADIEKLNQRIISTETELAQARSILDELVKKDQPAPQIEAQKKKVVILEDQVFDLNDEKLLKQIESEIE